MASATESRHKSRVFRDISRNLMTDHSIISSTGSQHGTVSDTSDDFDPENPDEEVFQSTQQMNLDLSQRLPELRDTAKKYGRWNGGRQPDSVINTSAIGRAFPDFSDDSIDIEVPRGARARQLQATYSSNVDSPVVTVRGVHVLGTPPLKGQSKISKGQDSLQNSQRKESQSKHAPRQEENMQASEAPKSRDNMQGYISGATVSRNGEPRRKPTDLHAEVADESDGPSDTSYLGKSRPATVSFTAKNSRFTTLKSRNSSLAQANSILKQPLAGSVIDAPVGHRQDMKETSSRPPSSNNTNNNTLNPTAQSFLLPNMPEISDIVSGAVKGNAPVFIRGGKVQTRFASASAVDAAKENHAPVDGIPVPGDEKAIFLSLELLQERVAALEMEKADSQRVMDQLQKDNYQLRAENREFQHRRRSDSALGDSGSDAEHSRDNKKLIAEKTKLEAQLKSVQARLDASERKVSNQELRLKSNTAERDEAVKQLTEATYNSDRLQSENQALRQENEDLRQQLAQFLAEAQETSCDWERKEAALRKKLQRRDQVVKEMQEMTREIQETREKITVHTTGQTNENNSRRASKRTEYKRPKLPESTQGKSVTTSRVGTQSIDIGNDQSEGQRRGRSIRDKNAATNPTIVDRQVMRQSRSRSRGKNNYEKFTFAFQESKEIKDDESGTEASDEGLYEETGTIHKDINLDGNDDDLSNDGSNFSSILGHGGVDQMRKVLANERDNQLDRLAAVSSTPARVDGDTTRSIHSVCSGDYVHSPSGDDNTVKSKSSAKGLTGILKNRSCQSLNDTGRLSVHLADQVLKKKDQKVHSNVSNRRRHSEDSIQSCSTRHVVNGGITSAFILPDITINGRRGTEHPVLSNSARHVLDNLAQHDGHNCTVCTRVASFQTSKTAKVESKPNIRIEKPIPVSDRMPAPAPYEDEPTLRPSVAPGLALATVLKGLNDELAHLKMELHSAQTAYHQHDPSLGMRKRKYLTSKIEALLKAIDTKADQIYALYDVLEGQKQSGQELSEKDLETTLQSIGVDIKPKEGERPKHNGSNEESELDEGSDLDLPWEGIEDTTSTGGKGRRQSSRI